MWSDLGIKHLVFSQAIYFNSWCILMKSIISWCKDIYHSQLSFCLIRDCIIVILHFYTVHSFGMLYIIHTRARAAPLPRESSKFVVPQHFPRQYLCLMQGILHKSLRVIWSHEVSISRLKPCVCCYLSHTSTVALYGEIRLIRNGFEHRNQII